MNNNITSNPFNLPPNAYAAFDATSLKSLMQQRLVQGGVFTDQIFEGSNFNSLLDIIAYSYNVLLFYLNKTASESMFSQVQLYENMNKVVKILGYNPIGYQSSVLPFQAAGSSDLPAGIYTIPRYSFFTVNGLNYTFTTDTIFTKTTNGEETLTTLSDSNILYQGSIAEYPLYVATGTPFEQFSLVAVSPNGQNEVVDHSNIFVYVKDKTQRWSEWSRVASLYLQDPNNKVFECRLNENQRYVLKFGDGVTGKALQTGDLVSVFYLRSDGTRGEIGPNLLNNNDLFLYNSILFNNIFADVRNPNTTYLTSSQALQIAFTNENPSTSFANLENSDDIRNNAPNFFKTQNRLITTQDYQNYISTNFNNIISNVKVVNNWEYLAEHVRYLYNLGLKSPNLDSRVLYNQVMFSDSCDFNNIYVYLVPKFRSTNSYKIQNNFLATGLKDTIINGLQDVKMATTEIVPMDPVYTAFAIGLASNAEINNKLLTPDLISETTLVINRNTSSFYSESEIKNQVYLIIKNYFNISNASLGQTISLTSLAAQILSVNGVDSIQTKRTVGGQVLTTQGISFLAFNPIYSEPGEDIAIITQNITLPFFKLPYLYNEDTLLSQITVQTSSSQGASLREY
jgi:hypothetical protein